MLILFTIGKIMRTYNVIHNLRLFTDKNCNTTLDPKLCEDIRYLCDETERLTREIIKANNYIDDDFITIQRYKRKLQEKENQFK